MKPLNAFCVAALLFPLTGAIGQTPTSRPNAPTAITSSFTSISAYFAGRLLQAFDSIPASKFTYAPTPVQQSIGYVAQHLVDANYNLCGEIGGIERPRVSLSALTDSVKAQLPKDTLVAWLRDSFRFCTTAMSRVDDANLGQAVPIAPNSSQTQSRSTAFVLFVTDLAEHYAQIGSYMRLIGLVPPNGLSPGQHVAIALAPAMLSRYVGVYEVAPGTMLGTSSLQFEITFRDGVLTLKPEGQPAARLWPESETSFFFKEISATITFALDSAGNVTGLVLHNNGEDRPGKKRR